jgi:hypothetical protein
MNAERLVKTCPECGSLMYKNSYYKKWICNNQVCGYIDNVEQIEVSNLTEIEKYKKTIFQLDELIRHLLVDSNDIKAGRLNNWLKWLSGIKEENKEVYESIYKQQ